MPIYLDFFFFFVENIGLSKLTLSQNLRYAFISTPSFKYVWVATPYWDGSWDKNIKFIE